MMSAMASAGTSSVRHIAAFRFAGRVPGRAVAAGLRESPCPIRWRETSTQIRSFFARATQSRLTFGAAGEHPDVLGNVFKPELSANPMAPALNVGSASVGAGGRRSWLFHPGVGEKEGSRSTDDSQLDSQLVLRLDKCDEYPLFIIPLGEGAEVEQQVYEAMNRNNRKPKTPNHGKRPCSRWRRRRKTYGINADGSKK